MLAYVNIKTDPCYRRQAFVVGLGRLGYSITARMPSSISKKDVMVTWNRHGQNDRDAERFSAAGGRVLVTENGYCGVDKEGRQYYALALDQHNAAGKWHVGEEDRFAKLGIELKPWQINPNGHILVCGQRGIGSRTMASPTAWHNKIAAELQHVTKRPVRIRHHPGATPRTYRQVPLTEDLKGAYAVVIWSSGAGVKALIEGIPVFYCAPYWIGGDAARRGIKEIDMPQRSDQLRKTAFEKLAWAQWSVAELESGEPFERLLGRT